MSTLTDELERQLAEDAELRIAVEEDEGRLVLTGLIESDDERETALDIVRSVAGTTEVIDNLEVTGEMPVGIEYGAAPEDIDAVDGETDPDGGLEAGDFTDQPIIEAADLAEGPSSAFEDDETGDGAEIYVPPTDPVGNNTEVIGGLAATSMDDLSVERSSDGQLGDEAIAEAVVRELREDAATTDLSIEVEVEEGVVTLHGTVDTIDDAENAEEVASRLPGVVEVDEELDVEHL